MKTIAFHLQKGGVGKTTLCGNTAAAIRHHGHTLMIDADPQGNLTSWYLTDPARYELSDVLQNRANLRDAAVEVREDLDLLPTKGVGGDLKAWAETQLFQKPYAIQNLIEDAERRYEFLLWDLGPGLSNLEMSILAMMDEVVPVVSAEYFGIDGVEMFETKLEELRRDRRATFRSDKLVINRFFKNFAYHKAFNEQYEKMRYDLYRVGQSTDISDCVPNHQSLFEYRPGNKYTGEIQRLATDLLEVSHVEG